MRSSLRKIFMLCFLIVGTTVATAQTEDAEGCKDHPFFNRLPNFYIQECFDNYNEHEFYFSEEETKMLEGNLFQILYTFDSEREGKMPSIFQVIKNYESAILKNGGKKVYSSSGKDGSHPTATFTMQKDGTEYWVGIQDIVGGEECDQYRLIILSKEAMKQEISANEMFEKINAGDALTLYINFETGKSVIQSESQKIIDELYTMLSENSDLKVIIEGHTDNVGDKSSNQALSQKRAESVKQALINKGISADRMKAVGYGQDKPVADNSSEDGKAKNRRVEIKKM